VVTLNIRPTISRVIDKVNDPNPEFANASVISEIPVIQVREIESVLQVNSGDTAIIGGLMQDTVNDVTSGVPFLSSIPIIGGLFSYKDDQREKSELVIFIRPIVVKHASLNGDLSEFQKFLPAGKNDTTAQD
jgi:general secretion pathway protein D